MAKDQTRLSPGDTSTLLSLTRISYQAVPTATVAYDHGSFWASGNWQLCARKVLKAAGRRRFLLLSQIIRLAGRGWTRHNIDGPRLVVPDQTEREAVFQAGMYGIRPAVSLARNGTGSQTDLYCTVCATACPSYLQYACGGRSSGDGDACGDGGTVRCAPPPATGALFREARGAFFKLARAEVLCCPCPCAAISFRGRPRAGTANRAWADGRAASSHACVAISF